MLLSKVIAKDFSQYWEINDAAHRLEHFTNVEKCAFTINMRLGLWFNPRIITLVAMFHDMFAWSRHNHHELSARWVETTDYHLIAALDPKTRQMVADGCREHRASRTEGFTSEFTELMNAADRELPGRVPEMLERAIQFRMHRGDSRDEAIPEAIKHIKDKFGRGGYARYPSMYRNCFQKDLEHQYDEIDAL